MFLTPTLVQIFLPCYSRSQISSVSEQLMRNFFHSDWVHESQTYYRNATIFMEMSKKPLKILAAGVGAFEVNLESFRSICNSAYSLFALFKKM